MNLLAALHAAGVVERSGRPRTVLRVSPRFLAHAEATAARVRGGHVAAALEAALSTWDEFRHDPRAGAEVVRELLVERGQLGLHLPAIETFAAPA